MVALPGASALALPPTSMSPSSPPGAVSPPSPGSPGSAPAHPSAPARIRLRLTDSHRRPVSAVIVGERLRVVGDVRPFLAGQAVIVRFSRDGRRLGARRATVVAAGRGRGRLAVTFAVGGHAGTIGVRASSASPQAPPIRTAVSRVVALPSHLSAHSSSSDIRLLQRELAGRGYAVPIDGRLDSATGRAVLAFRKLSGLSRTDLTDFALFSRMAHGGGSYPVRYPRDGRHFEADLTHQVLAEINPGGRVRRIYTMSSGKPSTPTVIGSFRIYSKQAGTNSEGMVDASYFIGGYAIHGYADVPPYAASHGCLRMPIPDAGDIFAWARVGERVDVYTHTGRGSHRVRPGVRP